ncbi:MAG: ABC transporter ATP-binding protein [Acidobacteriaceae bacterium]|nr:ABC transporter ATP-binding protein [Acidobacteriaceae bacterium]
MTILEARNVEFGYCPGAAAVLSASIAVESGTLTAVIGSNGSGKSTLIRVVAGLLQPWSGGVFYRGRNLLDQKPQSLARQLAYVPQNASIAFPFTALEVVLTGRAPYHSRFQLENAEDQRIAMNALDQVGIAHLAHRRVTELSGGERQMVTVARALAQEPECLLLDEPSSSLDLKHRSALIRLLLDLRERKGLTVLMITHDLMLLEPGFDHVFALRCGRIAASGPPQQVITGDILVEVYDDAFIRTSRVNRQVCVWSQVHR